MNAPRDRRRASALQDALERYERLRADGIDADDAAERAGSGLTASQRRTFDLAAGLHSAGERSVAMAAAPDPEFVRNLATRLRTAEVVRPSRAIATVVRPRFGFAPLALAACVALFAALLVPSLQSLPGDRLYGLKSFSEDSRLVFASGATEARVRLDLADERFSEVEALVERSSVGALGRGARADGGPVLRAAGVPKHIGDPKIAALIEETLQEAGRHLQAAADILTKERGAQAADLDELVTVSRRGHKLATAVAEELPNSDQPPVLSTVVKLAKIEAAAKAARTQVDEAPTPPPCDVATPSPEPTPTPEVTPAADGGEELTPPPTEEPSPSPTQEPSPTPKPTPCTTPEPTPTPTPSPTPSQDPSTEPTLTPGVEEGVEDSGDGDETTMDDNGGSADAADHAAGDEATTA